MSERNLVLEREIIRVDGVTPGSGARKHLKMTMSPFVFFRGSSQLFYADLASDLLSIPKNDIPLTTVMGDCHTSNFGFFTEEGSHGDKVIFAVNDFDDACIGNPLWDIARFMVSLHLSADHCQRLVSGMTNAEKDYSTKSCVTDAHLVRALGSFVEAYLAVCQSGLDGHDHLNALFEDFDTPSALTKRHKKAIRRASGGDQFVLKSSLAKAVGVDKVPLSFRKLQEKFIPLDDNWFYRLKHGFEPYMNDRILDIVQRIGSGTGSVNMQRYYFLVGPENPSLDDDLALCHIVEVKQQRVAAPLHYFPDLAPQNRLNAAHLTVMCQRLMQRKPDIVLDKASWNGSDWLVRSRHHAKVGIDPEDIGLGDINTEQGGFVHYAKACGTALALAHCRGDRRSLRFEQSILGTLPAAAEHLLSASYQYAEQVKHDFEWLCQKEGTA